MVLYPVLIGEMAKREITKKTVAQSIGVCDKALSNKLNGKTPFTWPEVRTIGHRFFPDLTLDELFTENRENGAASGLHAPGLLRATGTSRPA